MTSQRKALRDLAEAALAESETGWKYIDGPLVGDVCVETRPTRGGRSRIRLDPGALGPFIAAASPDVVIGLLDEIDRLQRDYLTVADAVAASSTGAEDLAAKARRARQQLAAAQAEVERLRERLIHVETARDAIAEQWRAEIAAMTAARNEACDLAAHLNNQAGHSSVYADTISNLRKVGQR